MLTLSLRSFIAQVDRLDLPIERYPYCYSERSMVKLFLYSLVKGIRSFKSLRRHLIECPEVLKLVGLETTPHRTTLSRRFKALYSSLSHLLRQLRERFVLFKYTDPSVMSVDSTLIHAQVKAESLSIFNTHLSEICGTLKIEKQASCLVAVISTLKRTGV